MSIRNMLRRFFTIDIITVPMSKTDYWKKWELHELFNDLHLTEDLLNQNQVVLSTSFEEFKYQFTEELYEIQGDNVADFTIVLEWFKPNGEWDLIMGLIGKDLGLKIFQRADRWKRNQEFLPETIVSLNDEFGVVLKSTDASNVLRQCLLHH